MLARLDELERAMVERPGHYLEMEFAQKWGIEPREIRSRYIPRVHRRWERGASSIDRSTWRAKCTEMLQHVYRQAMVGQPVYASDGEELGKRAELATARAVVADLAKLHGANAPTQVEQTLDLRGMSTEDIVGRLKATVEAHEQHTSSPVSGVDDHPGDDQR